MRDEGGKESDYSEERKAEAEDELQQSPRPHPANKEDKEQRVRDEPLERQYGDKDEGKISERQKEDRQHWDYHQMSREISEWHGNGVGAREFLQGHHEVLEHKTTSWR